MIHRIRNILFLPLILFTALSLEGRAGKTRPFYPVPKGNYLVCPNGMTIPRSFWGNRLYHLKDYSFFPSSTFWDQSLDPNFTTSRLDRVHGMNSEVIIGKKTSSNYDKDVVNNFKYKMLRGRHNIPTSYKHTSISLFKGQWHYIFKNSEGKKMRIVRKFGNKSELTNHQGKTFKVGFNLKPVGLMYCDNSTINLRIVQEINLESITNKYGEKQELPLIFWLIETKVKAESPKSENKISF